MRPVSAATLAAVAAGTLIALDPRGENPQLSVQVVVTGTNTSTVQVTNDDIYAAGYTPGSGNWFSAPVAALVGLAASQIATMSGLYSAIRLNMTAYTNGGATLRIVPSSGPGG